MRYPYIEFLTLFALSIHGLSLIIQIWLLLFQSQGGYDHLIGTSEHGQIINSSDLTIPTFRYSLLLNEIVLLDEASIALLGGWSLATNGGCCLCML